MTRRSTYAIGQFDKYAQIQARPAADTGDGSGFPIDGPFTDAGGPVAMARRALSASEKLTAGQISASGDYEWEMSYQPSMDPDLVDVPKLRRLVYQNRIHDIQSAEVLDFEDAQRIRIVTLARSGS